MVSEQLAEDVLQHVAALHDDDQEGDEQKVAALEARHVERQQGRDMADAVKRDHDRPLLRGDALQEALGVAMQRRDRRHQQEAVYRDEDHEESVPRRPYQPVLKWYDDAEHAEQHPMVAAAAVRERHELAQRGERDQREQDRHAVAAEEEGDRHQPNHHPPGVDALREIDQRRAQRLRRPRRQDGGGDAGGGQHHEKADDQDADFVAHQSSRAGRGLSARSAARARSRKARRSSPGATDTGAPKTTRQSSGTGRN